MIPASHWAVGVEGYGGGGQAEEGHTPKVWSEASDPRAACPNLCLPIRNGPRNRRLSVTAAVNSGFQREELCFHSSTSEVSPSHQRLLGDTLSAQTLSFHWVVPLVRRGSRLLLEGARFAGGPRS